MPSIEYDFVIERSPSDWIRIRITTHRGEVTDFTVQYETAVDGKWLAVIRYDCAHGFPHVDLLNRRGEVFSKSALPRDPPLNVALELGISDLRSNWLAYRARLLGDDP